VTVLLCLTERHATNERACAPSQGVDIILKSVSSILYHLPQHPPQLTLPNHQRSDHVLVLLQAPIGYQPDAGNGPAAPLTHQKGTEVHQTRASGHLWFGWQSGARCGREQQQQQSVQQPCRQPSRPFSRSLRSC
jgi:hypothetical protein